MKLLLLLLLLLLFHFFVWSGAETAWEGGLTLEARLGRALASGDQTRQHPPFLSTLHTGGFKGLRGCGRRPGGRQNCCNIVPPVSGDVTAADISRIVAVSQSVAATTLDTASLAAVWRREGEEGLGGVWLIHFRQGWVYQPSPALLQPKPTSLWTEQFWLESKSLFTPDYSL